MQKPIGWHCKVKVSVKEVFRLLPGWKFYVRAGELEVVAIAEGEDRRL
jgi:hypothetical protein